MTVIIIINFIVPYKNIDSNNNNNVNDKILNQCSQKMYGLTISNYTNNNSSS